MTGEMQVITIFCTLCGKHTKKLHLWATLDTRCEHKPSFLHSGTQLSKADIKYTAREITEAMSISTISCSKRFLVFRFNWGLLSWNPRRGLGIVEHTDESHPDPLRLFFFSCAVLEVAFAFECRTALSRAVLHWRQMFPSKLKLSLNSLFKDWFKN